MSDKDYIRLLEARVAELEGYLSGLLEFTERMNES